MGCGAAVAATSVAVGKPAYAPQRSGGLFMVAGSDGAMWMIDQAGRSLTRVTLSGRSQSFRLGARDDSGFGALVAGPDGALWLTTTRSIVRVDTDGRMRMFPLRGQEQLMGLNNGPGGALWFTASGARSSVVGKITTDGAVSAVRRLAGQSAGGIVGGPDVAVWTTVSGGVDRIDPRGGLRHVAVSGFASDLPTPVVGGDGALWFGDGSALVRLTTAGQATRYKIGDQAGDVVGLAAGPDGNVWFVSAQQGTGGTEDDSAGEVERSGQVKLFGLPAGSDPVSIAAAPNGQMWVATALGSRFKPTIYRLMPQRPTGGWPAAPTPAVRIDNVVKGAATVTTKCRGERGSFCSGSVSVAASGGRRASRALVVAAGSSVPSRCPLRVVRTGA